MSASARERERIRWRCRRGMLELDLVLNAFLERHLEALDLAGLETLNGILMRTDPELLELLMGRADGRNAAERAMLEIVRGESCNPCNESSTRPASTQAS
jgi:antitoxin CptB